MGFPAPSDEVVFRLPDFTPHCPFKPAYHINGDAIAAASERWFEEGCRVFTEDMRRHLVQLKAGQLVAYCYSECEDHRLRVICDFMNVFFLLDDLSEDLKTSDTEVLSDIMINALAFPRSYRPTRTAGVEHPAEEPDASSLTRDYWIRCIADARPGVQTRFVKNFELYLVAVKQEVKDRTSGEIPSLETYIKHRQLSTGCKPVYDLIEYSLDMELPDYVLEDPILETMKDCVNNFLAWSNDIFSYNVEQSRGVTHNIIVVIMENYDLNLQGAIDHAGNMCIEAIESYCEHKSRLPSYGPELDKQVAAYTRGLESWVSGALEWSFLSLRYFGGKGQEIRRHREVKLLSRKRVPENAA